MSNKQSYMNLLKQAISEFDTSDNLEVKGPMLDPIISWDGGGEIPTYKDAASILERYYFNEEQDNPIQTLEEEDAATQADKHTGDPLKKSDENDKGEASGKGMQNAKGTGTEQAGTSDSPSILGSKAEKQEDIAKEDVELALDDLETALEEDLETSLQEDEWSEKDVPKAKKFRDEEMTTESEEVEMENAIIEKLISEMEEDDLDEADVMGYTGDDVAPGMNAKDEKKSRDSEEDTMGAGTHQAGTGPDEGQIPDRKDVHDKMVKPEVYRDENMTTEDLDALEADIMEDLEHELSEEEDMPKPDDEGGAGDEGEDLDVDSEMKESLDVLESELMEELDLDEQSPPPAAVPGGPSPKKMGEDYEDDEGYYGEAFELFKEEIENEDVDDIDSDDLRV